MLPNEYAMLSPVGIRFLLDHGVLATQDVNPDIGVNRS